jgi:NitT/TauT family transport system substrate-binding protein
MFRSLAILLAFIVCISGCSPGKKRDTIIRVSVLNGPSAIVFAKWIDDPPCLNGKLVEVMVHDSPEKVQADLIRQETDIAVLPMINAANLYNKGSGYLLAGCPLWGTLFIVGRAPASTLTLHSFGPGTTPDILTRYHLKKNNLNYQINYSFGSAGEMAQALLAKKADIAVLSEPFVSFVLQRDSSLHIQADLNNPDNKNRGFAQTAILLHPFLEKQRTEIDSLIAETCRFAESHPEEVIAILESAGIFGAGILTKEAVKRNKIHYLTAGESKEEIYSFLKVINSYEPKAIGGKLPDHGFIYGKP